jgi:hypothetical protein
MSHDTPLKSSPFIMKEREIKYTKSEIEGWDVYKWENMSVN